MADIESTKAADDAFFAQLLADLEHDEGGAANTSAASRRAPGPDADAAPDMSEDLWTLDLPPSAPPEFSAEDRSLRALLVSFYKSRNPANLASVNDIVTTYRGNACDLWAQLAVKYQLLPVDAVTSLAKTLYPNEAASVATGTAPGSVPASSVAELTAEVERGGLDALRLFLVQSPVEPLRALSWKLLLGYLPAASSSEWPSIQQGRRAAYGRRRKDSLVIQGEAVSLLTTEAHLTERMEAVKDEVEQTVRHFHHQVHQRSLLSIMALYLVSSDGNLPLVQGMTHMAAILLHVFTVALSPGEVDAMAAEADAFWCFAALMAEIKGRIGGDLQQSTALVHGLVGTSDSLLYKYDVELAQHFQSLGFEPGVVCLRWFMLLFAKDAELQDLVSWWDALLADPRRFELAGHLCLAQLLQHREELLEIQNLLDAAELLQRLPSREGAAAVLRKARALRAFEARSGVPPFPAPSTVELVTGVAGAFFSGIFSNF